MDKFEKTMTLFELLNEDAYMEQAMTADRKHFDDFSIQTQWAIKKSYKNISSIVKDFKEMKNNFEAEIRDEFFGDEKSESSMVKAEDGTEQEGRKVKDEYMDDYKAKILEVNNKLNELLQSEETVTLYPVDFDKEIERMNADSHIDMNDLDMLSILNPEG